MSNDFRVKHISNEQCNEYIIVEKNMKKAIELHDIDTGVLYGTRPPGTIARTCNGLDTDYHFGNPFKTNPEARRINKKFNSNHKGYGTLSDTAVMFVEWIKGNIHKGVEPTRRAKLYRAVINGELVGKKFIYYTASKKGTTHLKELIKYIYEEKVVIEEKGLVLYTDGGAKPNPGFAGAGVHGYYYNLNDDGSKCAGHDTTTHGYHPENEQLDGQFGAKRVTPLYTLDYVIPVGNTHTNNHGEALAISQGILNAISDGAPVQDVKRIHIKSDSTYALGILGKLIAASTPIGLANVAQVNKEYWKKMAITVMTCRERGIKVTAQHVKAHSGLKGNELADDLATAARVAASKYQMKEKIVYAEVTELKGSVTLDGNTIDGEDDTHIILYSAGTMDKNGICGFGTHGFIFSSEAEKELNVDGPSQLVDPHGLDSNVKVTKHKVTSKGYVETSTAKGKVLHHVSPTNYIDAVSPFDNSDARYDVEDIACEAMVESLHTAIDMITQLKPVNLSSIRVHSKSILAVQMLASLTTKATFNKETFNAIIYGKLDELCKVLRDHGVKVIPAHEIHVSHLGVNMVNTYASIGRQLLKPKVKISDMKGYWSNTVTKSTLLNSGKIHHITHRPYNVNVLNLVTNLKDDSGFGKDDPKTSYNTYIGPEVEEISYAREQLNKLEHAKVASSIYVEALTSPYARRLYKIFGHEVIGVRFADSSIVIGEVLVGRITRPVGLTHMAEDHFVFMNNMFNEMGEEFSVYTLYDVTDTFIVDGDLSPKITATKKNMKVTVKGNFSANLSLYYGGDLPSKNQLKRIGKFKSKVPGDSYIYVGLAWNGDVKVRFCTIACAGEEYLLSTNNGSYAYNKKLK